ncbi:hypothetical protein [Nocardia australiensis]|uniref:hypothetical protein n=1 Tax=Nocardia australiensis TaxID=2887191 RepID=UPI001D140CD2|nr:hypothetical protein [Nocardia australiensis]
MDADDFTYPPAAVVDADNGVIEQLDDGRLRNLARTAAGLSLEAQQYLAMVANRLRVKEGLPSRGDAIER